MLLERNMFWRMRACSAVISVVHCSSRMLKKSTSVVLASLRGSTYRSVRLASSLAAVALDGHLEHPSSRS